MGANSTFRKFVKRAIRPVFNDRSYSLAQAFAKAWDIRNGSWYEPEIDLIPLAVSKGDTALDIGANYGLYSYYLSRAVGPRGKVYAFEPIPFNAKTFRVVQRLLGFSNVELVAKGCSDQDGKIVFSVPVAETGALSTGPTHMARRNDERPGKESQIRWASSKEVTCEVIALDGYLRAATPVSLIKCDVEGAELFVFRGAERVIETDHPTVICEINPWYLQGFNLATADLVDFFIARDYRLFAYSPGNGGKRLRPVSTEQVVEDNYVFIHQSRIGFFDSVMAR